MPIKAHIWPYNLSKISTATINAVIWENSVSLRNTIIWYFPGTYGLWVLPTDTKLDKDSVKIKLRRYPTLEKLDISEFKIALFDCIESGEFLFFLRNFKLTLKVSVTLASATKIQYLRTLVCGKALHQLDMLSFEVGSTTTDPLNLIILGLGTYFSC